MIFNRNNVNVEPIISNHLSFFFFANTQEVSTGYIESIVKSDKKDCWLQSLRKLTWRFMAELISRCYARSCKIDRSCIELCAIRATRTHDDYNRARQITIPNAPGSSYPTLKSKSLEKAWPNRCREWVEFT